MRGRLIALGVVAAVALAAVGVAAWHSTTSGCAYAVPVPNLPAALRAQGGFDQPIDSADNATLAQLAQLAATSSTADLIGTKPATAVTVKSADGLHAPAVVVPLLTIEPGRATEVAGVVVFLRDCSGRLHYSVTDDFGSARLARFPAVTAAEAQTQLGGDVELLYVSDPAHPEWRALNGQATVAAG